MKCFVTSALFLAAALCARRAGAMKVEVMAKTGHAESENKAYSRQDAWKWLLR